MRHSPRHSGLTTGSLPRGLVLNRSIIRPAVTMGIFALLLCIAFIWDGWVAHQLAQPIKSGQLKAFLTSMRSWGEAGTILTLCAGLALCQPKRRREIALMVLIVLVCAGVTEGTKLLFARHRPQQSPIDHASRWHWTVGESRNSSFPSGHTTTAFAFAQSLSHLYPPLKPVAIFAASATGLSRMYDQRHFFSDCVTGAFIGWYLSMLLWKLAGRVPGLRYTVLHAEVNRPETTASQAAASGSSPKAENRSDDQSQTGSDRDLSLVVGGMRPGY